MNKEQVRKIILEILEEEAANSSVKRIKLQDLVVNEQDRMDTGNPEHRVFTHDVLSLQESPRMGCGVMEMEHTTFPWTLNYDEIDYVIAGHLKILEGTKETTVGPGEVVYIPKGSHISFSAKERVRFLYVTDPADWKNQK